MSTLLNYLFELVQFSPSLGRVVFCIHDLNRMNSRSGFTTTTAPKTLFTIKLLTQQLCSFCGYATKLIVNSF